MPLDVWRTVIFTDESKFCILGIKGRKLVWRKPCKTLQNEHLVPMVMQGGSGFMVRGCMARNDEAMLEYIESIMTNMVTLMSEKMFKGKCRQTWHMPMVVVLFRTRQRT
ncbi:transposable element Tc1 transposase [Trichonephila clavipes]|nr:transposable element Tc1 transposase [Trichonephila clavipes]